MKGAFFDASPITDWCLSHDEHLDVTEQTHYRSELQLHESLTREPVGGKSADSAMKHHPSQDQNTTGFSVRSCASIQKDLPESNVTTEISTVPSIITTPNNNAPGTPNNRTQSSLPSSTWMSDGTKNAIVTAFPYKSESQLQTLCDLNEYNQNNTISSMQLLYADSAAQQAGQNTVAQVLPIPFSGLNAYNSKVSMYRGIE